jgi:beta-galactosidase GanA
MQFRTVGTNVGDVYDTLVDASGANPGTSQAQAIKGGGFNHAFADPFDPRWEASLRKRVQEIANLFRGKTYFAGWMADNERSHRDIYRYVWSPHCAVEFGKFLRQKYGAIEKLNGKWGASFASFDELLAMRPDPVTRDGAMYEDFRLFSREILRRFNDTVLRIIHEEDPGRLVFTNRFMIGEARDVFENLDLYSGYDAIAVNVYPSNIEVGYDRGERQYMELLHEKTGKPLLITEWSVPARDSGLYENYAHLDWSYPQTVATQEQRARQTAECLMQLYNLPYVIGAHWFTWSDIDTKERQANRGLFDARGNPWTELQRAIAGATGAIAAHER